MAIENSNETELEYRAALVRADETYAGGGYVTLSGRHLAVSYRDGLGVSPKDHLTIDFGDRRCPDELRAALVKAGYMVAE